MKLLVMFRKKWVKERGGGVETQEANDKKRLKRVVGGGETWRKEGEL